MGKKESKNPQGKGKRTFIYVTAVVTVSFLLSLLLMFLVSDAFSLTAVSGTTEIVITEDTGVYGASEKLKDAGLIDSRLWFSLYSRLRGKAITVKAGSYKISNTGGFDGILSALSGAK